MSLFVSLFLLALNLTAHTQAADPKTYDSQQGKFQFEFLTQQQDVIWGFDFLDEQRILFSERRGTLRILDLKTKKITTVKGAPDVRVTGQGGLLDVRVHPTDKSKIYLTYSEASGKGATTAVGVGTLKDDQLTGFKKLFSAHEANDNRIHFGSRIDLDGKGFIFISVGDRDERHNAQKLGFHTGKILRLKEDGTVPTDNPFAKNKDAKPEVWSYGHRNPQGLVYDVANDRLWSAEMGPLGGDELNLIKAGANYGWPVITYGREYSGGKIGEGTSKKGMEQPIAHWVPSISPSALTIYTGSQFPKWKGNIFIGNLSGQHLRRLTLEGTKVTGQEELLKDLSLRIRNVRTGPDGAFYLSTDDGRIARLSRP